MVTKLAPLADRLAAKLKDNRAEAGWEEELWEEIQWIDDLDTKQVDILFGMVVARWDKAKRRAQVAASVGRLKGEFAAQGIDITFA